MNTSIKQIILTAIAASMLSTGAALAGETTQSGFATSQQEDSQSYEVASTEMLPVIPTDSDSIYVEGRFVEPELFEDYEIESSWGDLY